MRALFYCQESFVFYTKGSLIFILTKQELGINVLIE